jgi:hypothetical protein
MARSSLGFCYFHDPLFLGSWVPELDTRLAGRNPRGTIITDFGISVGGLASRLRTKKSEYGVPVLQTVERDSFLRVYDVTQGAYYGLDEYLLVKQIDDGVVRVGIRAPTTIRRDLLKYAKQLLRSIHSCPPNDSTYKFLTTTELLEEIPVPWDAVPEDPKAGPACTGGTLGVRVSETRLGGNGAIRCRYQGIRRGEEIETLLTAPVSSAERFDSLAESLMRDPTVFQSNLTYGIRGKNAPRIGRVCQLTRSPRAALVGFCDADDGLRFVGLVSRGRRIEVFTGKAGPGAMEARFFEEPDSFKPTPEFSSKEISDYESKLFYGPYLYPEGERSSPGPVDSAPCPQRSTAWC